jgi:hypothetical protein
MESTDLTWRKASYSSNGGEECVEVGQARRSVLVRDTNDRGGAALRFSPAAWRRFAEQVKRSLASPAGDRYLPGGTADVEGDRLMSAAHGSACDGLAVVPALSRCAM